MRDCLSATDTRYALSDEERVVVRGLANGETERSLASQLGIAASTVHARKMSSYNKLRHCLALKGFRLDSGEREPVGRRIIWRDLGDVQCPPALGSSN